ncbi:MAG TPA: lipid-binding SYLF domain-containing protein [Terriglobia bacterium]|nr:lipid-binding SYLF domain-containing protein [Terriglobia bacterium]
MKKLGIALVCLLISTAALASEVGKEADQIAKANEVLGEIMQTPDKSVPQDLLNRSVCVGIVPSELKFAFIVGGNYGRGVLVCRRHGDGAWGAPSLFRLGGGSFGLQIGGKATDIVFIVQNPKGARKLLGDNVKLGADASVAGGPVGRSAEGSTDAEMQAEILSYSRSRGVFAGLSLAGAVLKQDEDANERLYGKKLTAKDILIQGVVAPPPAAKPLIASLAKYSPHGGKRFSQ